MHVHMHMHMHRHTHMRMHMHMHMHMHDSKNTFCFFFYFKITFELSFVQLISTHSSVHLLCLYFFNECQQQDASAVKVSHALRRGADPLQLRTAETYPLQYLAQGRV